MDERQQKRELRRKLAILLSRDDNWHSKPDSELYRQITELGQKLSGETAVRSKEQLRRNAIIDKEQFLKLREEGIPYTKIAELLNVTDKRLLKWRRENGL